MHFEGTYRINKQSNTSGVSRDIERVTFFFFSESEGNVGEDICTLAFVQAEQASTPATPEVVSPDNVSAESHKLLERWEDRHVRLLISSYSKFKHHLGKGMTTKKEVFAKIATEFNSISEKQVTADQCLRKWSKLESKQKEIEDNNKQTGRARKSWKYHDDMSECMGSSPKVSPGFTFDTSSSSSSGTNQCDRDNSEDLSDESGDDESEDKTERKKKKAKPPTRKRKSNSSAAEMLQFLHSYSEKREKVEEEKLALMKSTKDEKKEFYSQFLELLKNK